MREVKFKEGLKALEELTAEDIKLAAELLLIEDETGGGSDGNLLSLDYCIVKEKLTSAGGDDAATIKKGSIFLPNCSTAGGTCVSYPEGMPMVLLYHFRQREFKGEGSEGAECGTPFIEVKNKGEVISTGDYGYKFGECSTCPHNSADPDVPLEDKCLGMSKIIMLTMCPDETGELVPLAVQFKGAGIRSRKTRIAITAYIKEVRGKGHGYIGSFHTVKETGTSVRSGKGYEVHQAILKPSKKLKESAERKDSLKMFKETMAHYYVAQHLLRTNRNNAIEAVHQAAGSTVESKAVEAIEHSTSDSDIEL